MQLCFTKVTTNRDPLLPHIALFLLVHSWRKPQRSIWEISPEKIGNLARRQHSSKEQECRTSWLHCCLHPQYRTLLTPPNLFLSSSWMPSLPSTSSSGRSLSEDSILTLLRTKESVTGICDLPTVSRTANGMARPWGPSMTNLD